MNILLTGGSACGKSTFAESLCEKQTKPLYYIATMRPYDDECLAKIAKHQKQRAAKGFWTIEQYTGMDKLRLPKRGTALLECVCNLTANEMFDDAGSIREAFEPVLLGIEALAGQCEHLVVVTNDVGSDCRVLDDGTERYNETLGRLNTALAQRFDCVCELVCGIPLVLKGELP